MDSDGQGTAAYTTLQVLSNVPPMVDIITPTNGTTLSTSNPLFVRALASDLGGAVQRVDFYLRHHHDFGIGALVATATATPYTVDLGLLTPEDYVVTALATDDGGATAISLPVLVTVVGTVQQPVLTIRWMADHLMVGWAPSNAILQEAETPRGPWNDLSNASNPWMVFPGGKTRFYRAYLP